MCGIAGFLRQDRPDAMQTVLRRMTKSLTHRGPDAAGYWWDVDRGVALGHRRLSILELSELGSQPMVSRSGRYTVVFNGEIYNFRRIRDSLRGAGVSFRGNSDTEVMLAAFDHWGIEASLPHFVGMFAFAVWDSAEGQLVLARDRLGKKPLYYGFIGNGFAFGSELKALREFTGWDPTVDRNVLALFFRYGYVPGPWSIYDGVKKLQPAHVLRVGLRAEGPQELSMAPYWSAAERQAQCLAEPFSGTLDEATDALDEVLRDAVKLRMISDVPLGAFLSGGIDSSLVVALMQSEATAPIRTFTVAFDEVAYNEANHAREVARYLGTEHSELHVSPEQAIATIPSLPRIYDEPFSDSSQVPTAILCSLARRHVVVSLTGDGGDEGFAGYHRYIWFNRVGRRAQRIPKSIQRLLARIIESASPEWWERAIQSIYPVLPSDMRLTTPGDRLYKLAGVLGSTGWQDTYLRLVSHCISPSNVVIGATEANTPLSNALKETRFRGSVTERMMLLDTLAYLPDDILVKVDRASMAVGLEMRAPLLDHRVLEFAWRLPIEMKLYRRSGKTILKRLLHRHVPREIVDRPKTGFAVPIDSWLRGPLKGWAGALLAPERLRVEGYLDPGLVQRMWREHLSGARGWHHQLWDVLMFQLWLESSRERAVV